MENKSKKFFSVAFTLTGTIIGAGVLGLPYVFSKAGFFVGLFWLIFLGTIMIFANLYMGEVTLRTKKTYQLSGYSEKYLGKFCGRIMSFAIIFGIYSALLAYLIGEGQSFSKIFTGGVEYSLIFGISFWIIISLLLQGNIKRLKTIEFWGVIGIAIIIFIVFLFLLPTVNFENINSFEKENFFFPFGVVLFALLGFTSIPELKREVGKNKNLIKKSILIGTIFPVIIYIIFSFIFVGVFGKNVLEVATISFSGFLGKILLILGIFTMFTSYFVLSFALKDYFRFDLKKRRMSFFFVSLLPLIIYLLNSVLDIVDFTKVLGVGGVISGGITGILILFTNLMAKKKGDRKPEYSIPISWFVIGILSLIFFLGMLFELI